MLKTTVGHSFSRSFGQSVGRPFVRSCVRTCIRACVRTCIRAFVRSYVRSIGRSFVKLLYFVTDNPPTLPGVDDSKVYVSTTNYQYHDDAEEFLFSEVLSHYGDVLVSFNNASMRWSNVGLTLPG